MISGRFSCGAGRATENVRLGRSNPVVTRTGSLSPRRRTTSAATWGVAVAVEAISERAPT